MWEGGEKTNTGTSRHSLFVCFPCLLLSSCNQITPVITLVRSVQSHGHGTTLLEACRVPPKGGRERSGQWRPCPLRSIAKIATPRHRRKPATLIVRSRETRLRSAAATAPSPTPTDSAAPWRTQHDAARTNSGGFQGDHGGDQIRPRRLANLPSFLQVA